MTSGRSNEGSTDRLSVALTPAAFLKRRGGVRRMAVELSAALSGLDVEVDVVVDDAGDAPDDIGMRTDLRAQWRQHVALLHRSPNRVVHSLYYDAPFWGAEFLVVTVHDMIHERLGIGSRRLSVAKRRAVQKASVVVCDSDCTAADLRSLGLTATNLLTIPLGVSDAILDATGVADPFGGGPYLMYVGDRTNYKNFTLLIDVLAASSDLDSYALLVVGGAQLSAGELDDLRGLRRGVGRVSQLTRISDAELGELYRGASALVVTSRYEGFGLPLLEAMASGCPVANSGGGSLAEFDDGWSFRFDPDSADECRDAIHAALMSDDAHRLGAQTHARTFTWQRTAENYLGVYGGA